MAKGTDTEAPTCVLLARQPVTNLPLNVPPSQRNKAKSQVFSRGDGEEWGGSTEGPNSYFL